MNDNDIEGIFGCLGLIVVGLMIWVSLHFILKYW